MALTTLRAGAFPTGSVVQTVSATKTDHFSTAETTFQDVTGLSVSITPSSTSNKILVMTNVYASKSDAAMLQAVRGSTAIGSGDDSDSNSDKRGFAMIRESANNLGAHYNLTHLDSPSTTSSTTYKVQVKANSSGDVHINRRESNEDYASSSSITVMEIKG